MYIASRKRKENIAEYLLYMWQIEDLIRANSLELDSIKYNIIDRFSLDDRQKKELSEWYESLIDMMRREGVINSGHLQININVINQLADLHQTLLKDSRFAEYRAEFYKTLPYIVELRSKSGDSPSGEIETCFNALYGVLMLKLKGESVSSATKEAIDQISKFIAMLAHYYNLDQDDKLFNNDIK